MNSYVPFWLLRAIRDGEITNASWVAAFLRTRNGKLFGSFVSGLQELGAIHIDKKGDIEPLNWIQRFVSTFDLSLAEMSHYNPSQSIIANPVFGKPETSSKAVNIFVLMPFEETLTPVYESHIKAVAARRKLTIARADDFFKAEAIMQSVWATINAADTILADCTGRNPNVFYEIGIAHTLGKTVILISQTLDDVPFDLRHLRSIIYEYTPRGMRDFEENLAKPFHCRCQKSNAESQGDEKSRERGLVSITNV